MKNILSCSSDQRMNGCQCQEKAGPKPGVHTANTVGFVVLKSSSGETSADTKRCRGKVCMIQELSVCVCEGERETGRQSDFHVEFVWKGLAEPGKGWEKSAHGCKCSAKNDVG